MIEEKIKELGFEVPEAPKPVAAYIPAIVDGNLVFTAGQLPFSTGELKYKGKLGKEVSEEEGQKAAELCALNCLSAVKSVVGSLDKIERILKVTVFVNSASGFVMQPKVANGASEFFVKVFGEQGKHVRSAVGVNELPMNAPVEVEIMAKLKS
ncbi:MAG: RidA family protein [Bacteroidota bacterium]|nr:RidA family protein [Bacteroidota bacterium]MDP4192945.1 RidA family protein [Bacteroidota bacterium]MDP4196753.1 RidA family protein [Bacteroidota bacterium]